MKYEFHPAAEAEFLEAIQYYESHVPGLGRAFSAEAESMLLLLCEQPDAWTVESPGGIRRAQLGRFPFSIIYRKGLSGIQVLAIAHERRRPFYWVWRA